MTLLAGFPDIDSSPSVLPDASHRVADRGKGGAHQDVGSAWWILSALQRIAGPQLHGVPGTGRHRQTGDAVALCQLRRLRG
jgi:hypothetical protein